MLGNLTAIEHLMGVGDMTLRFVLVAGSIAMERFSTGKSASLPMMGASKRL